MFSIARSIFSVYSVMTIFKSSIVWGLFEYTEFFIAGGERSVDLGGQIVVEMTVRARGTLDSH
jgi:hypothetical protein